MSVCNAFIMLQVFLLIRSDIEPNCTSSDEMFHLNILWSDFREAQGPQVVN